MAVLPRARETDGQALLQAAHDSKGTIQWTEKVWYYAEVIVPVEKYPLTYPKAWTTLEETTA